jgi:hypothetical protein
MRFATVLWGGDPVCLHRAAYWHAQEVLDFEGEPEPPASPRVVALVESFSHSRQDRDYLAGALRYLAATDQQAA